MLHLEENRARNKVNVLKKVKVRQQVEVVSSNRGAGGKRKGQCFQSIPPLLTPLGVRVQPTRFDSAKTSNSYAEAETMRMSGVTLPLDFQSTGRV